MKINKYHKRFLESFSAENVIAVFSCCKNASKEITESWAMFEAAKKVDVRLDDCQVIIVGDGASPRTGVIFAYYTKADVISVDPGANMERWKEHCAKQTAIGAQPERLSCIKEKIEDVTIDCDGKIAVVVWPHSHGNMNKTNIQNYSRRIDIAMPCCVPIPSNWMSQPHIVYTDFNVLSPKRDIHIWGIQGGDNLYRNKNDSKKIERESPS